MHKSLIALVLATVLAGCSSGVTSEPTQPEFDGDYGFENIDPGFGQDDTDNDGGYENVDPEYGVDAPGLKDKIAQAATLGTRETKERFARGLSKCRVGKSN